MEQNVKSLIEKIEKAKKGSVDLSRDEDLSIAIMNLISLEEHFYFTAMKTEDGKYLDMLDQIRLLRVTMLKKIVTDPKGEEWCISKHLLASSMRLIEVGTKELRKQNKKQAEEFFNSAFELYSMFFAINLKLIDSRVLTSDEKNSIEKKNETITSKNGFSAIIKKIVNCCKEW